MINIEFTLEIARPPAEVFAYITDTETLPDWQSSAIEAEWVGEKAAGAHVKEVRKFLGRRIESEMEVTAYEPGRHFALRAISGPIRVSADHRLEPTDGGTRLTFVGEGDPGGFFKLATPIVARTAERQFRSDFETMKDILESGGDR
jgi:uncharacterized protein YndB with AHSA1/START domain